MPNINSILVAILLLAAAAMARNDVAHGSNFSVLDVPEPTTTWVNILVWVVIFVLCHAVSDNVRNATLALISLLKLCVQKLLEPVIACLVNLLWLFCTKAVPWTARWFFSDPATLAAVRTLEKDVAQTKQERDQLSSNLKELETANRTITKERDRLKASVSKQAMEYKQKLEGFNLHAQKRNDSETRLIDELEKSEQRVYNLTREVDELTFKKFRLSRRLHAAAKAAKESTQTDTRRERYIKSLEDDRQRDTKIISAQEKDLAASRTETEDAKKQAQQCHETERQLNERIKDLLAQLKQGNNEGATIEQIRADAETSKEEAIKQARTSAEAAKDESIKKVRAEAEMAEKTAKQQLRSVQTFLKEKEQEKAVHAADLKKITEAHDKFCDRIRQLEQEKNEDNATFDIAKKESASRIQELQTEIQARKVSEQANDAHVADLKDITTACDKLHDRVRQLEKEKYKDNTTFDIAKKESASRIQELETEVQTLKASTTNLETEMESWKESAETIDADLTKEKKASQQAKTELSGRIQALEANNKAHSEEIATLNNIIEKLKVNGQKQLDEKDAKLKELEEQLSKGSQTATNSFQPAQTLQPLFSGFQQQESNFLGNSSFKPVALSHFGSAPAAPSVHFSIFKDSKFGDLSNVAQPPEDQEMGDANTSPAPLATEQPPFGNYTGPSLPTIGEDEPDDKDMEDTTPAPLATKEHVFEAPSFTIPGLPSLYNGGNNANQASSTGTVFGSNNIERPESEDLDMMDEGASSNEDVNQQNVPVGGEEPGPETEPPHFDPVDEADPLKGFGAPEDYKNPGGFDGIADFLSRSDLTMPEGSEQVNPGHNYDVLGDFTPSDSGLSTPPRSEKGEPDMNFDPHDLDDSSIFGDKDKPAGSANGSSSPQTPIDGYPPSDLEDFEGAANPYVEDGSSAPYDPAKNPPRDPFWTEQEQSAPATPQKPKPVDDSKVDPQLLALDAARKDPAAPARPVIPKSRLRSRMMHRQQG